MSRIKRIGVAQCFNLQLNAFNLNLKPDLITILKKEHPPISCIQTIKIIP